MLQSDSVDQAAQMFAATSLKGKVRIDCSNSPGISRLTKEDDQRSTSSPTRCFAQSPTIITRAPSQVQEWSKANSNPAVHSLGTPCNTNDRVEECLTVHDGSIFT
jgi:hypothetical protein